MSAAREFSQVPANKLYINLGGVAVVDQNLAAVTWASKVNGATIGTAIFRDLGKTLYLPDPTNGSASIGAQSTILRKVQWIPNGVAGSYGTGGAASTPPTEFYTGYVQLGGQTYGGGNGVPSMLARLN